MINFKQKNRTNDGQYEINTGIRKLDKLLKIEKWKHSRTLGMWRANKNGSPSTCQYINGTDATAASPFRQKGDSFFIFSSDICRYILNYNYYEFINALLKFTFVLDLFNYFMIAGNAIELCFTIIK